MVVYFKRMRKLLIILCMGLCFVSCTKAQNEKEATMKEYQAKDIVKLINKGKTILFVNAIIKDDLDFSAINDMEMASPTCFIAHVPSTIYFQSCVFLGEVKGYGSKPINQKSIPVKTRFARNVQFMDCDFRKGVDFSEAVFDEGVHFNKSVFRKEALFNNILSIGQKNQWWEIEADSTFMMCGAIFRGDLNMMDANFKQDASLQGINVNDLQISNLHSAGGFDLSTSTFNGYFISNYATCEEMISLSFCKFGGRTDIVGSTFEKGCEMERSLFYGEVNLSQSKFKAGLNTKDAHFLLLPKTEETLFEKDSIPSFDGFNINK